MNARYIMIAAAVLTLHAGVRARPQVNRKAHFNNAEFPLNRFLTLSEKFVLLNILSLISHAKSRFVFGAIYSPPCTAAEWLIYWLLLLIDDLTSVFQGYNRQRAYIAAQGMSISYQSCLSKTRLAYVTSRFESPRAIQLRMTLENEYM